MLVDVQIGRVDDASGLGAFQLVVPRRGACPTAPAGNHCGLRRLVQVQPCTFAFRLDADAGSSRVLPYQRGDERVRWHSAPN